MQLVINNGPSIARITSNAEISVAGGEELLQFGTYTVTASGTTFAVIAPT